MTEEELNNVIIAVKAQRPIHWEVAEDMIFEIERLRDALKILQDQLPDYSGFIRKILEETE